MGNIMRKMLHCNSWAILDEIDQILVGAKGR